MNYTLLALMFFAHCLADFPLQGDYLARFKDPNRFPKKKGEPHWTYIMLVHSTIHGGFVAILTGVWWLAVCEVVAHFLIDSWKCSGRIGFMTDQILHILCKVLWVAMLVYWLDVQPYESLIPQS